MPQLQRIVVNTSDAPQPIARYSQAVRVSAGEFVYLAGQVGLDADGNLVGAGDVAAQTHQTFDNLGRVLASVGASFGNVVEFTVYLVGRESIAPFREARDQIFPTIFPERDYPASTLVVVSGLVREELLVEIKAVAALQ